MIKSPPIFILIGPPAVGKSTTSRVLASRFEKSVHLSVDHLRDMVVSGLELPNPVWSAELVEQIAIARKNAALMAANYREAGFCVVVDDFWDANFQHDYHDLMELTSVHKIILFPQQETAHQRNFVRADGDATRAYIDDGIRIVYEQLKEMINNFHQNGWIVVDSSEMNVEETADTILNATLR